jgi:aerobic-type carbon monoxide dehydrogenase small subunit (CoxS/CutS family)
MDDRVRVTQPTGTLRAVSLTVNGKSYEFEVEPQETLVEVLRGRLRLMRTKEGCGVASAGHAPS